MQFPWSSVNLRILNCSLAGLSKQQGQNFKELEGHIPNKNKNIMPPAVDNFKQEFFFDFTVDNLWEILYY